ncbi:MAG TPA: patatin-like phospholipase family protein, partial [Myxococcota bacterium]|nr:patatin-like phospholipase family protein [Myxococcota bacterium]
EMLEALCEKKDGRSVFSSFIAPPAPVSDAELERGELLALFRRVDVPFLPSMVEERVEKEMARWMASQNTLRHVYSFIEQGGWYSADNFVTWIQQRLDSGSYKGAPRRFGRATLAEFYAATQTEVAFVASDITGGQILVLNHRTAPDLPVAMAVRMSMSIPLLWQEVIWKPAWGPYRGKDVAGHAIVDGGLLSNFPVELLVSRDANVTALMGPEVSKHLLGFLIDETLPVEGVEVAPKQGFSYADLKTVNRLSNLLNTLLGARDQAVSEALERFVLRLPAGGFSTTEFDMSDARRELLLKAGREVAEVYLNSAAAQESVSFDGEELDRIPPKVRNAATKGALRVLGI